MPVQKFLDFAGIDVLSTADHHILDAANNIAISLIVDRRQVAGLHPPRRIDRFPRFFFIVPIPSMTRYPRVNSSPGVPRGTMRPSASTTLASTYGIARPTVDTRLSSGSSVAEIKLTGLVSVMP